MWLPFLMPKYCSLTYKKFYFCLVSELLYHIEKIYVLVSSCKTISSLQIKSVIFNCSFNWCEAYYVQRKALNFH